MGYGIKTRRPIYSPIHRKYMLLIHFPRLGIVPIWCLILDCWILYFFQSAENVSLYFFLLYLFIDPNHYKYAIQDYKLHSTLLLSSGTSHDMFKFKYLVYDAACNSVSNYVIVVDLFMLGQCPSYFQVHVALTSYQIICGFHSHICYLLFLFWCIMLVLFSIFLCIGGLQGFVFSYAVF